MDRALLARVRWGNVALAVAGLAVVAGLLTWTVFPPPGPRLPDDVARPVAPPDAPPEAPAPREREETGWAPGPGDTRTEGHPERRAASPRGRRRVSGERPPGRRRAGRPVVGRRSKPSAGRGRPRRPPASRRGASSPARRRALAIAVRRAPHSPPAPYEFGFER